MGQHAGTMDELAPGPQCAADRDTNTARPQPEHAGVARRLGDLLQAEHVLRLTELVHLPGPHAVLFPTAVGNAHERIC